MKTVAQRLKKRQAQSNRPNKRVQPKGKRCFLCNSPMNKGACSRNCSAPSFLRRLESEFPNHRGMFGNR